MALSLYPLNYLSALPKVHGTFVQSEWAALVYRPVFGIGQRGENGFELPSALAVAVHRLASADGGEAVLHAEETFDVSQNHSHRLLVTLFFILKRWLLQ